MSSVKPLVKSLVPASVRRQLRALALLMGVEEHPPVPFDNTYAWLNHTFLELLQNSRCSDKPMYLWGVLQAAALAKVLKIPRISVLELGVAGGFGLLSLEAIAAVVKNRTGVEIDVLGFDTGVGLPKPEDVRDQPNMWFEGQLPMDREALESKLETAKLVIGPVKDTMSTFIRENPAPVGFVSFDLDLYTSTRDAMILFEVGRDRLLPRVPCYFDDIFGHTYNEYCGERLAINEFNDQHDETKICPMHGLRYFLPRVLFLDIWPDCMYYAHCFDHPRYSELDSLNKAVITDVDGFDVRVPPASAWNRKQRTSPAKVRQSETLP